MGNSLVVRKVTELAERMRALRHLLARSAWREGWISAA
jgi:hypothetical protein